MSLVTGETLRARLERQLPIADAVRIAREVASALDYAHRQNVIHRDIKPENILLHDGSELVADFGIALAVQSAGGQRMTQTGLSLGKPQYMSPEQAMGERTIDARSDVYALGAVLYEMLTGEAPFTGGSVQAIVAKVLSEKPTPIHTLRDTVPLAIEQAVSTALAKLPADRFASAAEFVTALAEVDAPVVVNTAHVAPEKSIAVLPFANMCADLENEYFSDGTTEEILNALSQITDLRGASVRRASRSRARTKTCAASASSSTCGRCSRGRCDGPANACALRRS